MVEFLSYLYFDRMWARWELLALAAAMVLLLVAMRQKRKVKPIKITARPVEERPQVIGARLSERKHLHSHVEDNNGGRRISVPKQTGKKLGWREATQKCRSFRELVEQLQHEVIQYKRAEDSFKQQVVKLTTVNQQLEKRLTQRAGRNSELTGSTAHARILTQP
jgi:hypothetical protein